MVYTIRFFSSKCSLFHNSNVFGSCVIHILYTECAKIKKNNSGAKSLIRYLHFQNAAFQLSNPFSTELLQSCLILFMYFFFAVTHLSPVKIYPYFGGISYLHLRYRRLASDVYWTVHHCDN